MSRAKAEEEQPDFRDVLGRTLMVRLSQFLQQPGMKDKIQELGSVLHSVKNVGAFGERAKVDSSILCQRAFLVEMGFEGVALDMWTFFFPGEAAMYDLRILMRDRSMEKVGMSIFEEFAPKTAAAKVTVAMASKYETSQNGPPSKKKAKTCP